MIVFFKLNSHDFNIRVLCTVLFEPSYNSENEFREETRFHNALIFESSQPV